MRGKTTGVAAVVLGIILVIAGLVDHVFAAPKAALCQSGLGQLAQGFDGTLAHDCGLVTAIESAVGWLLVGGVLVTVFGAAVLCNARTALQPVTPAAPPARPVTAPPARPVTPPAAPADRPWWTQT
ncbi:MAG: hypothetical protein ACRDNT_05585 [Streptosporangiaceae bacterium]